jgi:hypothetical protein
MNAVHEKRGRRGDQNDIQAAGSDPAFGFTVCDEVACGS